MSNFDIAFDRVIVKEGGSRFTNHPQDRGGPTRWGVTQQTYTNYLGRPASVDDVRNMPKAHAEDVYRLFYWDPMNLDLVKNFTLAYLLFDQGVNRGTITVARSFQRVLNVDFGKSLVEDGRIGPMTIEAADSVDVYDLCNKFIQAAQDAYVSIVRNNNSQLVFLAGWINRSQKLFDYVFADMRSDRTPDLTPIVDEPDLEDDIESPQPSPDSPYDMFYDFMIKDGIKESVARKFIDMWEHDTRANFAYVFNYNKRCNERRLYMFSLRDQSITREFSTHGSGSDPNRTGVATRFSNQSGSHQSSLGFLKTAETYIGGNGRSLRLDGLSSENTNMRRRLVVLHGSHYARNCGRSQGCPTIDHSVAQDWIEKLRGGSPGLHYHRSFNG
jgi:lysozyme family protein